MEFKAFITKFIADMKLEPHIVQHLTTDRAIAIYKIAFTHSDNEVSEEVCDDFLVPKTGVYETYEQIGDAILKMFMVNYFYRRFPKLWENNCGVKIVARLIIKYGSKEMLSSIAEYHNFWPNIKTNIEVFSEQRRASILEDVFEAFIGATSIIIDCTLGSMGCGYIVAYSILTRLFDKIDIQLDYESLFDAKTRLKELIDAHRTELGSITYVYKKRDSLIVVSITLNSDIIGIGSSNLKTKAEQTAAQQALDYLKLRGFHKKVQKEYNNIIV